MNKSQSMGMYVILAIVVMVFISTIFMSGPTTSTSEISYTNFLQKLDNKEFTKIEKYDDMIIAIPKEQPAAKEEKKSDTKTESKNGTTGQDIVDFAKKFLGYKYKYGAASPNTGFDCSGLTYYVYKNFGYTLSRSAKGQAANGTKVEKSDLQPGDLVIYKGTSLKGIGHVGIYIGNNKMIHASEPGVGVIITDIDEKSHNYPKRYVMGRRILK